VTALVTEQRIPSRERRISTLSAYMGTVGELQKELDAPEPERRQRIRTLSQANADDILAALELLTSISDALVVVHGAAGCSAAVPDFYRGTGPWYSTALDERDTILGGEKKLRAVLKRAWEEHHPQAIFILGTPVTAINNDDVHSIILELEEEIGGRLIFIAVDGFTSKAMVNGLDTALHGLGRRLIGNTDQAAPEERFSPEEFAGRDFINLITVSENRRGIEALVRLVEALGFAVNVIPRFGSVAGMLRAGKARASIAINDSRSDVFLRGLEEKTGVVSVRTGSPIGVEAVSAWLSALGKGIGSSEEAILKLIEAQRRKSALEGKRRFIDGKPLKGRRLFIELPTDDAVETALFLQSLGAEITGLSIDSADETNRENLRRLPAELFVRVGNGQVYELAALFSRDPPDCYIAEHPAWAAEFGVIPLSAGQFALYGYDGAEELAAAVSGDGASGFADYLREQVRSPYKAAWLKKNPAWHIKQEVK
jgi:nitrogenase molybdenum-iron protein alpha chain